VGMGAVFVSLILLMVFIKVFAAIMRLVEARRTAKEEASSASSPPPAMGKPASSPEVTPEIAAAAAIALAADGRQEEIVAAVSYAVHNHISAEEAACNVPAAGTENGKGAGPWSMAGRMRLMNGRMRWVNRSGRG